MGPSTSRPSFRDKYWDMRKILHCKIVLFSPGGWKIQYKENEIKKFRLKHYTLNILFGEHFNLNAKKISISQS